MRWASRKLTWASFNWWELKWVEENSSNRRGKTAH